MEMGARIYKIDPQKREARVSSIIERRAITVSAAEVSYKRIDDLEETITTEIGKVLQKLDQQSLEKRLPSKVSANRLLLFLLFAMLTGVSFSLFGMSIIELIEPNWMFWLSISFALAGVTSGLFLILIGVDHDRYE